MHRKAPWTSALALGWILVASGCPGDDDDSAGPGDDDDSAGQGDDDTSSDDDDTTDEPFVPDLATGGCGAPDYDWAPMARMGEIVDWELHETDGFTAEAIDLLLTNYGIATFEPSYDVRVYRIRYLTQDRGAEVEATGLLSFPIVDEETEVPTLLWLHPTMGFNDDCAPSAIGVEGGLFNVLWSSLGFAVAAPDYLGMAGGGAPSGQLHPYVLAEPTAVASLDSLRALHRFRAGEGDADVLASPELRTVLWGASEGGFAALWSDRYAPRYAPEFDVVATVASVPPSDTLGLTTHAVSVASPTTAALAGVLATAQPWYGGGADMGQVFTDEDPFFFASTLQDLLGENCSPGDAVEGLETIDQLYTGPFVDAAAAADWAAVEPWSCYLFQSTLDTSEIPLDRITPTLYLVAGEDDLVVADVGRQHFPVLCEMGYQLEYLECAGAGHVDGAIDSLPYQWQWIHDRLDGEELAEPCVMTDPVDCTEFELMPVGAPLR